MSVLASMIGNAWRTTRNMLLVIGLLISLAVNVASFTVNAVSTAISTVVEGVTGAKTLVSSINKSEADLTTAGLSAKKLKKELAEKTAKFEAEKVARIAAEAEKRALKAELTGLRLTGLRAGKKVMINGAEKTVEEAVALTTRRVRNRTVKLAAADLSAIGGQAIPWIGVGVVVAATAYDINMSCQTMKDMKALEQAMNPSAVDESDVSQVCGLKVPTADEVWEAVKASPGQAWNAAASVLSGLPSDMPDLPAWWDYLVGIDLNPWN